MARQNGLKLVLQKMIAPSTSGSQSSLVGVVGLQVAGHPLFSHSTCQNLMAQAHTFNAIHCFASSRDFGPMASSVSLGSSWTGRSRTPTRSKKAQWHDVEVSTVHSPLKLSGQSRTVQVTTSKDVRQTRLLRQRSARQHDKDLIKMLQEQLAATKTQYIVVEKALPVTDDKFADIAQEKLLLVMEEAEARLADAAADIGVVSDCEVSAPSVLSQASHLLDCEVPLCSDDSGDGGYNPHVAPDLTVYATDEPDSLYNSSDEDEHFVEHTDDPRGIYWNQLHDGLQQLPQDIGEAGWTDLHHIVTTRARSLVMTFTCATFPTRRMARQGLAVTTLAKMLKEWENEGRLHQLYRRRFDHPEELNGYLTGFAASVAQDYDEVVRMLTP